MKPTEASDVVLQPVDAVEETSPRLVEEVDVIVLLVANLEPNTSADQTIVKSFEPYSLSRSYGILKHMDKERELRKSME